MSEQKYLPEDYDPPASGQYLNKFSEGTTEIRILVPILLGWQDWDKTGEKPKPVRYPWKGKDHKPKALGTDAVKHWWAMLIWNEADQQLQICEITQVGIQRDIQDLIEDENWGSPNKYGIKVKRVGTTMNDTNYTVTPVPHKALTKEVRQEILDQNFKKLDLNRLLIGEDPWDFGEPADETATEAPQGHIEAVETLQETAEAVSIEPIDAADLDDDDLPF